MNKKHPPDMTRKEALAVLHRLSKAVVWHLYSETASEEDKALRSQIYDAFYTLDRALHGAGVISSQSLCNICYLRLANSNYVISHSDEVPLKRLLHVSCCLECLAQIRAEKRDMLIERFDYEQGKYVIVERVSSAHDGAGTEVQV